MTKEERKKLDRYELRDLSTLTDAQLDEYADLLRKHLAELGAIIKRLRK